MNIEPISRTPVSREMRSIAAGLVQRLLADGGTCSRVLLRLDHGRLFLVLLIADGYGPARMLLGPHDEEELAAPARVELDDLEVDTVDDLRAAVARADAGHLEQCGHRGFSSVSEDGAAAAGSAGDGSAAAGPASVSSASSVPVAAAVPR